MRTLIFLIDAIAVVAIFVLIKSAYLVGRDKAKQKKKGGDKND